MPLPHGCTESWQKSSHYLLKKKQPRSLLFFTSNMPLQGAQKAFVFANLGGLRLKNKHPKVVLFSGKLQLSLSGGALFTNKAQRWVVNLIPVIACKHYKPVTLLMCCIFHMYFLVHWIKFPGLLFSFSLVSHGHRKSYKLLKMLKIAFIPAGDDFCIFFSISDPLVVMRQSQYAPLGSSVSPPASCVPGLLSVGVWFMIFKPLQIADYQIKFSKCWQLKCCHMLMLLHHWKSELSAPRRHIRLLVLCYPSGE